MTGRPSCTSGSRRRDWKPLSFTFAVAAPFDAIRFELTKGGQGKAVVAQIQAETRPAAECAGLSALDPGPRKNGARCVDAGDCASGICQITSLFDRECVGCDAAHPCAASDACGLGDPFSPMFAVPIECVPKAAAELGEQCIDNAECTSGICAGGACSECVESTTCGNGETCTAAWTGGPLVCGAGQHLGLAGEACGTDDDCASSRCDGTPRKECIDGRPCQSPANCPVDSGLAPGACTPVGIQGGSCE